MEKTYNILVVEDHELFRKGLIRVIKSTGLNFRVFGEAETEQQAINLIVAEQWDLIMLDIRLANSSNGLVVLKSIVKSTVSPAVIICSSYNHLQDEVKALGAKGFVAKNSSVNEIKIAVRIVLEGGTYFPDITITDNKSGLTVRQIQILRLIALGNPNKGISVKLDIAISTVEFHRKKLMMKTSSKSIADLTRYAFENGYMTTDYI